MTACLLRAWASQTVLSRDGHTHPRILPRLRLVDTRDSHPPTHAAADADVASSAGRFLCILR